MKPFIFLSLVAVAHAATPVSDIKVPPGFKVELLREAGEREGSWISMALDAEGRIYISPQGSIPESGMSKDSKWGGLWRSTVADGKVTAWEKVPVPVGDSMGMLWAFDSLYVSGNGPEGRGIYRCKDTDGDGLPDTAVMWKKVPGGAGEHGAHALVLSPDKKNIYIVHGNATGLIDGIAPDSPYRNWGEDDLIPKLKDPTATFFDSIKAPYGYVVRTDEAGEKWELIAGGFRNPYDIAFNADGELFTYDSDMEWDRGLPWYRPTRVLHIVPGGEYGFREGSAKMPAYYPDTLPAAVDIGLGCPTGVKFGTHSNFGEKYRTAFFACDWTYGRILAVHMKEKGVSYTATIPLKSYTFPKDAESSADVEPFVVGKGMPVTDVEFLKDGSMVFTTGGRGTSAGLYRVSWVGKKQPVKQYTTPEQLLAVNDALDKISDEIRELEMVIDRSLDKAPEQRARVEALRREFDAIIDPKRVRNIGQLAPFRDGFEILRDTEAFARLSIEDQKREKLRLARFEFRNGTPPGMPQKIYQDIIYDFRPLIEEESMQHTTFKVASGGRFVTQHADVFLWMEATHGNRPLREDLGMLLGITSNPVHARHQVDILETLKLFPLKDLPDDLKLIKLRILELSFARQGRPSEEWQKLGLEKLLASYPAQGPRAADLNRELSQLLVWLSQPELGDENTAAAPKAKVDGSEKQSDSKGKISEPLPDSLGKRPDSLGKQPDSLGKQPDSLGKQPDSLGKRPDSLGKQPDSLGKRPDSLGEQVQSLGKQVRPLGEQVRPLGEQVRPLGEQVRPLGEQVQSLGKQVRPLGEQVQSLGEQVRPLGEQVQSLGKQVRPLGERVQSLDERVQSLDERVQSLDERVQSLGKQVRSDSEPVQPKEDKDLALEKPVKNPGAAVHSGRKGSAFHAELGQQVIEKTLALMDAAPSQEEQIHYALVLRWAHGWTSEQRERYFRWFHEKAARFPGGNSVQGFIRKIHSEAMLRLNDTERAALNQWLVPLTGPAPELISPRAAINAWTLAGLEKELDALKGYKPDVARGKAFFAEAQCSRCHLFKDTGGNVGPDLTAVAQRFQRHDILEAITDPNKVVSDQYALTTLTVIKFGGGEEQVTGLLQEETSGTIRILTDPTKGTSREFYHNVVKKKEKAPVSLMPPGLLNIMTAEEVTDLLAYLGAR